jgi:signal transduction histidine kinase
MELAWAYNNLGATHHQAGDVAEAKVYYDSSLAMQRKLDNRQGIVDVLTNIGYLLEDQGQFREAIKRYKEAEHLAERIHARYSKMYLYSALSSAYGSLKDYKTALEYAQRYDGLRDSLFSEDKNKQLLELEAKYETGKKAQQIKLLEKDRLLQKEQYRRRITERNWLLLLAAVSLAMGGAILLVYRQKLRIAKTLSAQQEVINRNRINELMQEQEVKVLNAMIEGQEHERNRIAEELHDNLGSLLSTIKLHFSSIETKLQSIEEKGKAQYDAASVLLDEAVQEVRRISHNMASGIVSRFGIVAALEELQIAIQSTSKIDFTLDIHGMDRRLDGLLEINLFRIIQELVTNAIRHADARDIRLQLIGHPGEIILTVEDNGKGIDEEAKKKGGLGLNNVRLRVEKFKGILTLDSMPGKGTIAIVEIPITNTL